MVTLKSYAVITRTILDQLTQAVVSRMASGWIPQGGVAVIIDADGRRTFYQAMTMTKEEDM